MTIKLLDTNQTAVIRAAIPTVRSPILVVRWSETSIWQRRYGGWWDQSSGIRQSHYSDGSVTDSSSTVVEDIDLVAAVRWAARPIWQYSSEPLFRRSRSHYSDGSVTDSSSMVVEDINLVAAVRWQQDQFGGVRRSHYFDGLAIGPPPQAAPLAKSLVLVVYLIYKFKLKKYDHYGK